VDQEEAEGEMNMAKSFDELARRTMSKASREEASRRAKELMGEMLLVEVRKLTGKSQRELAEALGIKQPSLSKLEGQSDIQVSTLRRLIEALGGKLEIVARFGERTVKIVQFEGAAGAGKRGARRVA
jgi:plasmid maintenance system antidote protein VapI